MALLSGLGVGDEGGNPQQLSLVVDYLTGLLGGASEHSQLRRVSPARQLQLVLWSCRLDQQLPAILRLPCHSLGLEHLVTHVSCGAAKADALGLS